MKTITKYLQELEKHHRETYEHSLRVANLCRKIGEINQLGIDDLDLLYNSGLVHDIGKLKVPRELLSKKGSLSENERMIINTHVREGFLILQRENLDDIREVVIRHHEFSKSPYPRKIVDRRTDERGSRRGNNERFNRLGQILAISDIYDALTSERSYKDSLSKDKVSMLIKQDFTGENKYIDQVLHLN